MARNSDVTTQVRLWPVIAFRTVRPVRPEAVIAGSTSETFSALNQLIVVSLRECSIASSQLEGLLWPLL
jgi:selenophosphate synthase